MPSPRRRWYSELFPERYYIELQENTIPEQDIVNKRLMEVAAELKLPLVATNDCHYLNREDATRPRGAALHPDRQDHGRPDPYEILGRRVLRQVSR